MLLHGSWRGTVLALSMSSQNQWWKWLHSDKLRRYKDTYNKHNTGLFYLGGSWHRYNLGLLTMSVLNITGENADPVKGFVFREVSEFCKKRRQDDLIDKEEMERQQREERVEKNKAWRLRRAEKRGNNDTNSEINWDDDDQERRKRSCDILWLISDCFCEPW